MSQQGMPPGGFGDPSWIPPPRDGGGRVPRPVPGVPPRSPGAVVPGYSSLRYRPGASRDVTAGDVLSLAWETLTANFGTLVLASITYLAIAIGAGFVPVLGVISFVFVGPLYFSTVYLFVAAARREPVQYANMFGVLGTSYFQLMAINLLVTLAMLVAILPLVVFVIGAIVVAAASNGTTAATTLAVSIGAVGVLLGMGLGYFIFVRTWLAGTLYLDAPMGSLGIVESINLSWQGTSASWGSLILAQLAALVVMVLSVLLLIFPYLFIGLPFGLAVVAASHALVFPRASTTNCAMCGYDLASLGRGATCPECGTPSGSVQGY